MLRNHFERNLQDLQMRVLAMGSAVEENISRVAIALVKRDLVTSRRLIEADAWVNDQRIMIMNDCLKLIATQQPMARDMRFIAAVIEIVGELERIHDYVKGIAKTSTMLGAERLPLAFAEKMPLMAALTRDMLHRALNAFARNDSDLALRIPAADNMVDDLFNQLYADILQNATAVPQSLALSNQLEWTAHNMERAADRVINICEWVVYVATGEYKEIDSEYEIPPLGVVKQ